MAKERADKPRKEKAEKAEKKVSKDKVKKHKKEKKEKKEKRGESLDIDDDDEPNNVEDFPEEAEEPAAESSVIAEASETKAEKEARKAEKKAKKARKEEKKLKKAAAAEDAGASNGITLPVRRASIDSDVDGGVSLFAIDTKPTPVNPESIATKEVATGGDAAEEKEEHLKHGYNPPPSGLNRIARRRIRMIEAQREKIQKSLGVPAGSRERADEVQAQLDKWTADLDGKQAMRLEKKRRRKEKEAARIKSKTGKALTGRRLKEREKQLKKIDKKASKKRGGLSAPVEA
ncbi:hypothetical protein F4804DRAFT_101482 [Jackrogersella minutella]|nr:hypothetical protein F4804DRAFT_101482 [Jackrogersella minutella]